MVIPTTPLILIVDDDLTTNQMIQAVLSQAGFQTRCAYDVAEALEAIRQWTPDLILLDVSLPDGSGFDVCRSLQSKPVASGTPIIFISSNEDISTKVEGFDAGGVDYITKPVAGAEVIARVRTHLRLKHAYESLAELQAERINRLAGAQEALMPLPRDFPEAGFQIAIRQALKAGGDFYDVVPVGNQIVDYLVADASGHDLSASFWTAALKTLVTEYANPANSPRDILHSINNALRRILPAGVFFTMIYARLNRGNRRLSLVSAAHPPAIVISGSGADPEVVRLEGDVVGVFSDVSFGMKEIPVRTGDRFLLYSDGLVEMGGNIERGTRRLIESCKARRALPLENMVPAVLADVTEENWADDDIVLLGVQV
jgi:phosphoserine phosphatase RsbU/P